MGTVGYGLCWQCRANLHGLFLGIWLGSVCTIWIRHALDLTGPNKQGKGKVSPMNRLSELKERKKLDNNGFSLVELIIVIAIMAVLIGVLAPQYLKYVEKSRTATDGDNAVAIQSALQVWASDPDATSALVDGDNVKITRSATTTSSTAVADALQNAGISTTNLKLTNKSTYGTCTITYTINTTTGLTEVTIVNS